MHSHTHAHTLPLSHTHNTQTASCLLAATCPEYTPNTGEWVITLSKSVLHTEPLPRPGGRGGEGREREIGGGGRLFGVVAVHVRLDELVESFLAATSLKALDGVGCGDQGLLFSDTTFCYLIDHRARVLVHPALLAARAAGRPLEPLMEAMRRPGSDLLRDFGEFEPIMTERLLAADIFVYVRGTKGNSNFRFVSVNHSTLQEYSDGTRNTPLEKVSSSKWPQLKSVPLQPPSAQEGSGGGSGRGPARPPQGAGVLFTIPGVWRDTDVYFHHLADTKMYLVVATDYAPPSLLPFCGPLSQICPHVIQPLAHVDLKRKETCSEDASETDIVDDAPSGTSAFDTAGSGDGTRVGMKASQKSLGYTDMEQAKAAAGFYRTPTSFLALQAMREHYKHMPVGSAGAASSSAVIEDEWLECSYFNLPTWVLPVVIVFGVLLILTCFASRRRRTKLLYMAGAQQAIKNVQEKDAGSVTMVDADNDGVVTYDELLALASTQGQGGKGGLLKKVQALQGPHGELDDTALEAFRPLHHLQAKFAEDLWTRDTGTTAQVEAQIQEISSQVREIRGQFDFLQQRVQDQDVKSDTLILHQRKCLYVP